MDPNLSTFSDWKEWRRFRALALKYQGWSQRAIAEALGVSEAAVSRWLATAPTGRLRCPPLSPRPRSCLSTHPRPAAAHPRVPLARSGGLRFHRRGLDLRRIALVIQEEFGVRYHKGHVGKLLKELGWTPQMPIRRAIQRDEQAISRWRDELWPELLERARKRAAGAGFRGRIGLLPSAWAGQDVRPAGQTPVIREKQTRDHLSVMGGMTPQGKVYTLVRQRPLNGLHCIDFLEHLQR